MLRVEEELPVTHCHMPLRSINEIAIADMLDKESK